MGVAGALPVYAEVAGDASHNVAVRLQREEDALGAAERERARKAPAADEHFGRTLSDAADAGERGAGGGSDGEQLQAAPRKANRASPQRARRIAIVRPRRAAGTGPRRARGRVLPLLLVLLTWGCVALRMITCSVLCAKVVVTIPMSLLLVPFRPCSTLKSRRARLGEAGRRTSAMRREVAGMTRTGARAGPAHAKT